MNKKEKAPEVLTITLTIEEFAKMSVSNYARGYSDCLAITNIPLT